MEDSILEAISSLDQREIDRAIRDFGPRCRLLEQQKGNIFEHLKK